MDIKIRDYIINNFKDSELSELKSSIEESVKNEDEITLPGLGVMFEILWKHSDKIMRDEILKILHENMK